MRLNSLVLVLVMICLFGCDGDESNRSMNGMGVSRYTFEGCNYLVFKKSGDFGNSVLLDPNYQPPTCGKYR